jgi:hypothetical protein
VLNYIRAVVDSEELSSAQVLKSSQAVKLIPFDSLFANVPRYVDWLTLISSYLTLSILDTLLPDLIIPAALFPCLCAGALRLIFRNIVLLQAHIASTECAQGGRSNVLYTGISNIDTHLCGVVAVFQAVMTPNALPFLDYFLFSCVPTVISFIYMEAARSGPKASRLITTPIIIGTLIQTATFGFSMALYSLVYIMFTLHGTPGQLGRKIPAVKAEAVIFSILFGGILPTYLMETMQNPYMTALWQPFPFYISCLRELYTVIRSTTPVSRLSGTSLAVLLYTGGFIASVYLHYKTVIPKLFNDPSFVAAFFLPTTTPLTVASTVEAIGLDLLQWDFIFGYGSWLLMMLWFTKSARAALAIILWFLLAIPLLGPGAAGAGVLVWKELGSFTPSDDVSKDPHDT